MSGGSHEIWVKLALLQMAEILSSSIKDHGSDCQLALLWKYRNLWKGNTDIASQRIKFEKSDILKKE